MKRSLILFLVTAMLLCMGTVACAENLTVTLPENSYIDSVFPQADGSLIVSTFNTLYRVAQDGTQTVLAEQKDVYPTAAASPDGAVYAAGTDWEQPGVVIIYQLQNGAWAQVAELELNAELYGAQYGTYLNGKYYWLISKEGINRLISYDPEAGQTADCGDFGMMYSGSRLFTMGDCLGACSYDYDKEQNILYRYDPATGKASEEKVDGQPLSLNCVAYQNGQFWAIGTDRETYESALYQGPSLSSLTMKASPASPSMLVPVEDDCLLVTNRYIFSSHVLTDARCTLTINGYSSQYDTAFTLASGITLNSTYQDMATVLNTHSGDVDIFEVSQDDELSLKLLKRKGFYVDLSADEVLAKQTARLWPSISSHIQTEDGKLMAWPAYINPIFFEAWLSDVEDEFGLTLEAPTTLAEMLDQIQQMNDEGVFDSGSYIPLDTGYDQASMIAMVMTRYEEEQAVLGNQLFFDNDALRSLLEKIMVQVPKEDPYGWGEDTGTIYNQVGYGSISVDMGLPLRVSDDSPVALPTYATFLVVNPYSEHQAEAIEYLSYLASQSSEQDYYIYADMTEPLLNRSYEEEMAELTAQKAELEKLDPTAEVKEQLEQVQRSIDSWERNKYTITEADIAHWRSMANAMAVMEEKSVVYSDKILQLRSRLINGGMTVDEFLKGCDDYLRMKYAEEQ